MTKPHIAARQPQEVELKEGQTYAWCTCGLSSKQPFCDGSHKAGDFRPKIFKAEMNEKVWLCQCKQAVNAPFCDGTHKTL